MQSVVPIIFVVFKEVDLALAVIEGVVVVAWATMDLPDFFVSEGLAQAVTILSGTSCVLIFITAILTQADTNVVL